MSSGLFPEAPYWRWWLRRERKALLLGVGVFALLAGIAFYALKQAGHPAETLEATVVRFGLSSDYEGNTPLVAVRTRDGRLHQLHAHRSKLLGCTTGAPIRLMKRGAVLAVDPAGCRPHLLDIPLRR